MNWQYYYNYLKNIQLTHTTQQYCLDFLNLTQYKKELLSIDEINDFLNNVDLLENFNLFPASTNSQKIFEDGDYHLIAQLIFHLPNINLSWMSLGNPAKYDFENFYEMILGNSNQSFFYLNNISIGNILKNKEDRYILTFLFLLFLPSCKKQSHLWDYNETHICTTPFISEDNYLMLLQISEDLEPQIFKKICSEDKNLSIRLLENFMDSQTYFLDLNRSELLKVLPIYQLQLLAQYNCIPFNISSIVSNRHMVIFSKMLKFMDKLSYELLENVLNNDSSSINDNPTQITKF